MMAVAGEGWTVFGFMSVIDIVVVLALIAGAALGVWTGFIWQVIRLFSVVASLWVSWMYHPILADALGANLSEPVRQIGSAITVFVGMLLLCYLISYLFRDLVNALKPQLPDRVLGGVFGLVKAALLVGVVAFLVLRYAGGDSEMRRHVEASRSAGAMAVGARTFLYFLPDAVQGDIAGGSEPGSERADGAFQAGA
jgi:membrane protein required for colicin V production